MLTLRQIEVIRAIMVTGGITPDLARLHRTFVVAHDAAYDRNN